MKSFTSLGAFAAELTKLAVGVEHARLAALEEAAVIVETEAKRVLGTHDYGWPPLKPATIAKKATGDSPLLETGEMRDSIKHRVLDRQSAAVGSDNDKALWHELGTTRVPPRPFLMGAARAKEGEVRDILGKRTVAAIIKP